MVKVCIYCNRKYPDGNITFHKFPSDSERRKKWLSAMKISHEDIDKNCYLCSEHFADNTFSYYVVNNVVHRFLYIDAIPSIFRDFSIKVDAVTDLSRDVQTPKESTNVGTMQISQQNGTNDEESYYYKIINGVIHRFLKRDTKNFDYTPVTRDTIDEIPPNKKENDIDTVSNAVKFENILKHNAYGTMHMEESAKVKVLPVHPLPIEMWRNGDIDLKESICDFKTEQNQNHEPKPVYEDIMMNTDDMNLLIINNYSNLNGLNEVEINSYNPPNLEVNHQGETSVLAEYELDTEVPPILYENIVEEETSYEPKSKKACVRKLSCSTNDPNESNEDKSMKSLLYKCLENKNNSDLDLKLKKYTKCKLIQLLKTALNYIECLEDKLTISTEQNTQYENQILELENLVQSISDVEPCNNIL